MYDLLEIWNIFDNLKKEGEKCYQCIKIPLIKELIKIKDRKALVPSSYSGFVMHLSKLNDIIDSAWNIVGRKKLVRLKDVTNAIFAKAKNNPGLSVPEDEISNII